MTTLITNLQVALNLSNPFRSITLQPITFTSRGGNVELSMTMSGSLSQSCICPSGGLLLCSLVLQPSAYEFEKKYYNVDNKTLDYSCLITIIYPEPFLWIQKDLVRIIRKLVKYQIYFFSYLTLTSSAAVLKALAHTVSTILTMSCNRLWSSKMAKISWNSPNDNLIAAAASEKKKRKQSG